MTSCDADVIRTAPESRFASDAFLARFVAVAFFLLPAARLLMLSAMEPAAGPSPTKSDDVDMAVQRLRFNRGQKNVKRFIELSNELCKLTTPNEIEVHSELYAEWFALLESLRPEHLVPVIGRLPSSSEPDAINKTVREYF